MLGIAPKEMRDHPDPLQTRRIVAEWFRHLPALDVIRRQEHVIRAFDGMRHACTTVELDRVAAIEHLDASLEVDHRRLVKWYLENLVTGNTLGERILQVANDINRGFIYVYHASLDAALAHPRERRWQPLLPRLVARLIHFHGIDLKLRLFRGERWIPARWAQLHQLFLRASDAGVERVATAWEGADPLAPRWSVEQEYLGVLLTEMLDTGSLTAADIDWASGQLRSWSRDLVLEAEPQTNDGFYVDLSGTAGLARRAGNDQGDKVGYLDTTPLVERLDQAIAALRERDASGNAPPPVHLHRIATLEKIRPSLTPRREADLRRHPRMVVNLAATIRIGLPGIAADLNETRVDEPETTRIEGFEQSTAPTAEFTDPAPPARSDWHAAEQMREARTQAIARTIAHVEEGVEEIEIHGVSAQIHPEVQITVVPAQEALPASSSILAEPGWRVKDRSAGGWRLVSSHQENNGLVLGALVAVRPQSGDDWMLGFVRRVRRSSSDEFEAGMALISGRAMPVTLFARRPAIDEIDFGGNGANFAALGPRFEGLYLMPQAPAPAPARPSARTLIIPTSEHFDGRSLYLTTARSHYAVTLRGVVDQHHDWSWVEIQVSGRAARFAA